jgi:nucleoside-diphosphate-sugar epimerase
MVQADIAEAGAAERLVKDCDAVIHCAIGTSWAEPHKITSVTVGGTRRLAEAALAAGVSRFVHVSTMSVYGDDAVLTGVLDETTPIRPASGSIYGRTKAAAEHLVIDMAKRGLPAVVFRPARVYGPYSNIFVTRPLQAIAARRFDWLGSPDVPADMVYVDNVAAALVAACSANATAVTGQAFNVGDADASTWREFYEYFASRLGLDLADVPQRSVAPTEQPSALKRTVSLPIRFFGGLNEIMTSAEFKSLGRKVLTTDPVGTLPRRAIERYPALERGVRRLVGADDSLAIYQPEQAPSGDRVRMGSGGSVLSIQKLRERMGFVPPVSRDEALQLTCDWVRHARVV